MALRAKCAPTDCRSRRGVAAAWAGLEALSALLDLRTIPAELPPERVQGIEGARPGEPWNAEGVVCVEYRCRALQEYSLLSRM